MVVQQRITVPFAGHVIGQGVNSETAERVGTALVASEVGEDDQAAGQTADFSFRMVTSQQQLEEALNVGGKVDVRYGLFSGGATFDFAEKQAINSSSTYIVASCRVRNSLRSGKSWKPTAAAEPLIQSGDREQFRAAFGDRFVEAMHTGGELYAIIRVTSSKIEYQQNIAASLNGEFNNVVVSVDFKSALAKAVADTTQKTTVNVFVHQTGGVGDQIQLPGTDAVMVREIMNRFANAVHENPVSYEVELVTYDTLALPFPAPDEVEDKRLVLEDCRLRRQQYWTAISDLDFVQTDDAKEIFQDLPPTVDLISLQNRFRSLLNSLMVHARSVSRGVIEPTIFVPSDNPVVPRFKKRTSGSFGNWWKRRNDPDVLKNERFLIQWIAEKAAPQLSGDLAVASAEALEKAVEQVDVLDGFAPVTFGDLSRELTSLRPLPAMVDAPLREISLSPTGLEELDGLELFPRLEVVSFGDAFIQDLSALSGCAGLRRLNLSRNSLEDVSALAGLTALEDVSLSGNKVRSLDAVANLTSLKMISIASAVGIQGESLLGNPLADVTALKSLVALRHPMTMADVMDLEFADKEGNPTGAGTAVRVGKTNRFTCNFSDGSTERLVLMALKSADDLTETLEPVVLAGIYLVESKRRAVMCTQPDSSDATIPVSELAAITTGGGNVSISSWSKPVIGGIGANCVIGLRL